MAQKAQRAGLPDYAAPKPSVDDFLASGARLNRVRVDFLKIDVATALTFSGIALQTQDPEKRQRNRRSARRAYDTILGLIHRVPLTLDDAQILARNLRRLKSELVRLGEVL